MAATSREAMIRSAGILLAKNGYQATSFGAVLEHSGAPRGSIYHHFPGGKDELIAAAIDAAAHRADTAMEAVRGQAPAEVVRAFMGLWRAVLDISDFGAGCSVLAVTVSADSEPLLIQTRDIFSTWRTTLTDLLVAGGAAQSGAAAFAALLLAASEGAVVLARAERGWTGFDAVCEQLVAAADALT